MKEEIVSNHGAVLHDPVSRVETTTPRQGTYDGQTETGVPGHCAQAA